MSNVKKLTLDEALMRLAYELTYNNHATSLHIWWCHKYNRPIFHDNCDDYLEEELILEWYIDKFINDKDFKASSEAAIAGMTEMDKEWAESEVQKAFGNVDIIKDNKGFMNILNRLSKDIKEDNGEIRDTFGNK